MLKLQNSQKLEKLCKLCKKLCRHAQNKLYILSSISAFFCPNDVGIW